MSQKVKKDFLIARVTPEEKEIYEDLAKNVYEFPNTGEFLRQALAYILDKRPVLGKSFAPGSLNN